jgi:Fe-Mn family superoxide dismutase
MLTTRRQALKTLAATTIAASLGKFPAMAQANSAPATPAPPPTTGPFTLPPLPYPYEALEPHIDTETMHLHHDKHHAAYVAKLNAALAEAPSFSAGTNVDDLLKNLPNVPESIRTAVRNNGGGHSNHSLFWQTLRPTAGVGTGINAPKGEFEKPFADELGGMDKFKENVSKLGASLFGSGWVWLVLDSNKKLSLLSAPNQDSPLIGGHFPLFGIDVWEHAYYLKYHNLRADYIAAIWNVVNWDFISQRYATALKA